MSYKRRNRLRTRVSSVVANQGAFGSECSVTEFTLKVLFVCMNGQVRPQDICLHIIGAKVNQFIVRYGKVCISNG